MAAPNHPMGAHPATGSDNESGVAIILAMMFVVIAGGLVASGTLLMKSSIDRSEIRFRRDAQATQFARSGLTEALSWLRRQSGQPVTDFKPLRDLTATPVVNDTDDPVIGLVREFEIADDIWGRYEVWRRDDGDTDPARLAYRKQYQCEDLSVERGYSGAGNVWLIRCIGYVYQQRDSTKNWNEAPNRVIARATLEGEVQRLALRPPGQAAVCNRRGDQCTISSNGRVRGGSTGAGIFYPRNTGDPADGGAGTGRVTGMPRFSAVDNYDDSLKSVFGVDRAELRSMADLVVTNPADFPDPVPENAIVFAEVGALTLNSSKSLNGSGVVYLEGDLSIVSGNNSSFSGLLYVNGNLTMRETSDVYGAVVGTGTINMQGSGDYATVWYDDEVLGRLRTQVGQYRWKGAFRSIINRE